MKKLLAALLAGLILTGMAAAAPSTPKPGATPGDLLYSFDRFSEGLELAVASAPVIGSNKLASKVRANHAAERLAEAQKLAEKNKTEKVDKLMKQYSQGMNRSIESARKASNSELSERLGNVSDNNVEVLKQVKDKVPPQAQKGIQNAIENSQRSREKLGKPPQARGKKPESAGKGTVPDNSGKPEDAGRDNLEEELNASEGRELPEVPNQSSNDTDLPDPDNLTVKNSENKPLEELEESSNLSNNPDNLSGNSITGDATAKNPGNDKPDVRKPELPRSPSR